MEEKKDLEILEVKESKEKWAGVAGNTNIDAGVGRGREAKERT